MELTFGEQVKVLLKRRNMTIKELAEQIEEKQGIKMSRQNLTQRLMRDNFQEHDMRMIAEVLGCTLSLNLVDCSGSPVQSEPGDESNDTLRESSEPVHEPTQEELDRERLRAIAKRVVAQSRGSANSFITDDGPLRPTHKTAADIDYYDEDLADLYGKPGVSKSRYTPDSPYAASAATRSNEDIGVVPLAFRKSTPVPVEEADPAINPRTGEEYESNVVRTHPKLKGYIQVYDRSEHKWVDMTEWKFLGFQEQKKKMLGMEYKPPIYLD